MSVSLIVATGAVDIGWVTVEQCSGVIVEPNDVQCRAILDLDAQEPLGDFRQALHPPEPATDDTAHPRPTGILTVRPPAQAGRLGKAGPHLPRSDVEATGAFDRPHGRVQVA